MGENLDGSGEVLTPSNPPGGDFENDPAPLFEGTPLPPVFENEGGDILIDPSPGKENFNGAVTTVDSGGSARDASCSGRPGCSTQPAPVSSDSAVTRRGAVVAREAHNLEVAGSNPAAATNPCLGCGYCCSKAPCPYSLDRYCVAHPCPGLVWNGERYRCAHVNDPKLRRCCAIGAGCCSPLNTWRGDKILRQEHIESDRPPR